MRHADHASLPPSVTCPGGFASWLAEPLCPDRVQRVLTTPDRRTFSDRQEITVRTAYKVLAWLVAIEVVVQAAFIALCGTGLGGTRLEASMRFV